MSRIKQVFKFKKSKGKTKKVGFPPSSDTIPFPRAAACIQPTVPGKDGQVLAQPPPPSQFALRLGPCSPWAGCPTHLAYQYILEVRPHLSPSGGQNTPPTLLLPPGTEALEDGFCKGWGGAGEWGVRVPPGAASVAPSPTPPALSGASVMQHTPRVQRAGPVLRAGVSQFSAVTSFF